MSFTKKDLRSGDVIQNRIGEKFLVLKDVSGEAEGVAIKIGNEYGWTRLASYTENMDSIFVQYMDVVKVFRVRSYAHQPWCIDEKDMDVVFDRNGIKELTVAEISKLLGYTVKVIEG